MALIFEESYRTNTGALSTEYFCKSFLYSVNKRSSCGLHGLKETDDYMARAELIELIPTVATHH